MNRKMTWALDPPPEDWELTLGPEILLRPRQAARSLSDVVRATGSNLLALALIIGVPALLLLQGPDLIDLAASLLGPKARMLPLTVIVIPVLLVLAFVTFRIYSGRWEPALFHLLTPNPFLWHRGPDGRQGNVSRWLARQHIARVWSLALLLIAGWFASLVVVDLTDPPVTVEVTVLRTYCDIGAEPTSFATDRGIFRLAFGSEVPCVLPPGRYRLTLSAATNSVLAYDRLR